MARIELRYCTITLNDGLGLPGVDGITPPTSQASASGSSGVTTLSLQNTYIPRAANTGRVPIGARFTLASETGTPLHIVTGRTNTLNGANAVQDVSVSASGGTFGLLYSGMETIQLGYQATAAQVASALNALSGVSGCFAVTGSSGAYAITFQGALGLQPQPLLGVDTSLLTGSTPAVTVTTATAGLTPGSTTAITFSPALAAPITSYAIGDLLSFFNQQLEIKIGEGNCTYTEKMEYKYDLERGNLDAVREGNEVPVDMKFECVYEHITTGTGELICPMDALKGIGGASEWVTSDPYDPCQPYCVGMFVTYTPPCSGADPEFTLFPDYRAETREIDYNKAMISVNGKCNVTKAVTTRGTPPTGYGNGSYEPALLPSNVTAGWDVSAPGSQY
jgi:hypothetical protein